jgi:hypothetical protein
MKRFLSWQTVLALILLFLSLLFYFIHYLIFKDIYHIVFYLISDIAFLFLSVLIVTLVLDRLLNYREKQAICKKLNMVVGTFFSEVGVELLKKCVRFDSRSCALAQNLIITKDWQDKDFLQARNAVEAYEGVVAGRSVDLGGLKPFLVSKRLFLLALLENPNLLEHESFTELLWAVFHLTDELSLRQDPARLPDADYEHLSVDIKRVYKHLVLQWLVYMRHLKYDYPYLFSLAMRTNPFDVNASVEVK